MSRIQISSSTRLILAMFRLIAAVFEDNVGKAVLGILKKQYPDATIDANPSQVGMKLMAIVKKQVQGNETEAQDVLQEFLRYLVESEFDFTKGSPTWRAALGNIYSNARTKAISFSMDKMKRKKRTKSVDDAYGTRGDGGGDPSGGEGRIKTPTENSLGEALDDKSATKQFIELIDDHLDDLRGTLTEDARALFDLIFFEEEGGFSSDIKENMGQAARLKEKHPEMFERNAKRWSGFVGDLRKKLLSEIWNYIDKHLTQGEYRMLKETFYGDTDPSYIRNQEKKKVSDREDYQQGIDERKLSRWKWEQEQGELTPDKEKSFKRLSDKLKKSGVDVDAIPAEKDPNKEGWKVQPRNLRASSSHKGFFKELAIAVRVANLHSEWDF